MTAEPTAETPQPRLPGESEEYRTAREKLLGSGAAGVTPGCSPPRTARTTATVLDRTPKGRCQDRCPEFTYRRAPCRVRTDDQPLYKAHLGPSGA